MVKDRLKELQDIREKANLTIENGEDDTTVYMCENAAEAQLLQLLEKIGPLYSRIKVLNTDVVDLRKGMNDHSNRQKFGEKIADVRTEARSLFKSIQEIGEMMNNEWHLLSHVARAHHLSLVTFFSSANAELANLQADIHDKHKKYIEKELQITGQAVSDAELESLLERPAEIFNQNLLQETRIAKQSLLDIQERHEEVMKIEKSIIEVNGLFQELAMLVRDQGEKVDRIDRYVHEAKDRAEQARIELKAAQTSQTKARKKKFILLGILAVVITVVVIIIIVSV